MQATPKRRRAVVELELFLGLDDGLQVNEPGSRCLGLDDRPADHAGNIFHTWESIKLIQPNHLVIVPGRTSIDAAETYYNQIKNEFNANFSPCENKEIEKRVISIEKLIKESKYKNIIITGCGDEQLIWEQLKSKIKNDFI